MNAAPLVLVGNAVGGTLTVLRLVGGCLAPIAEHPVGVGCSTFAVDDARGLVHTAVKQPQPAIVTLALDRVTGGLTERGRVLLPDPLAYLALARDGGLLLGASYAGGWGATWPVHDGVVGASVGRVDHHRLHCVVADAAGRRAYWVALGDDLVAQTAITHAGALEPLDPPVVPLPPGAGPRHLVLDAAERCAYVMTEYTGEVVRFTRDTATGTLTPAESVAALNHAAGLSRSRPDADPRAEHLVWGADLHLARSGRFLVASERTASTLAVLELGARGELGPRTDLVHTEEQPRGFAVAPDGDHLVVAGEHSGAVAVYTLSEEGILTLADRRATGDGPNWVRFA